MKHLKLLLLFFLIPTLTIQAQSIDEFLKGIKNAKAEEIDTKNNFHKKAYWISLEQPVDHKNRKKGNFSQRIWLSHVDKDAPVVIITEGYSAQRNYTSELANLLHANQIIVEHRYFEESTPDPKDWEYLTVEQAANDHHQIIELFKKFYKGKWVSTGISKGGSTCMFHRAFFPNDVDVSVPYVAPINYAREDQRLFNFFHEVEDKRERAVIQEFQRKVLEKRDIMLPMLKKYAEEKGYTFKMGLEKAFELAVLEYPFALWQWGGNASIVPDAGASDQAIFDHFMKGSDISYVSDQSITRLKSFFYQAYTELGYYAYVPGDLKPLFKAWKRDTISSSVLLEKSDTLTFVPETMHFVIDQLRKHNPKMISITGENDPWGATAIEAADMNNTLKIIKPEGSHLTRIENLPKHQKDKVYETLSKWLGLELPKL